MLSVSVSLSFPWFSEHSLVAVRVLRLCLEVFLVYFFCFLVEFVLCYCDDFSVSRLSKPLSSSGELVWRT